MLDSVERPAGEKEMKIVMASLDDAGRTTNLYRMMLDTAATAIPQPPVSASRVWNTEAWSSLSGTLEDKKADDVIAYSGPDDKLGKLPFSDASRRSKAFEAVVYPLASMEERIEIPEGREAWDDHRLHTERTRRDDRELSVQRVVATATTRKSLTTIAAVSSGRTRCQRS